MIDVGTGDGRAALAAAARDPRTLAFGMDASAAAMAESSRRAAAPARRGGLPNAAFIVAGAEAPPAVLSGAAGLVTVQFPWGSLLRGCVGADGAISAGVAGLVAPGGTLELLLAPSARDGLDGVPTEVPALVDAANAVFAGHGLVPVLARAATNAEVLASGSTWARRLGAARSGGNGATGRVTDRAPVLIRMVRR
jgi:16S rRNA (adenine(1408)-N(1))-methyltransferase